MNCHIFLFILIAPNVLHQVCANSKNSTEAAFQVANNSNSTAPKQTSYFFLDPEGPGTYKFGYHVEDKSTENIQFRNETRHPNGTVTGSYGYLRPDGRMTVTNYVADKEGYRIKKKIQKCKPSSSSEASESSSTTTEIPALNLTSGTLPPLLVNEVMDKYQIDLSPNASPNDILHPNISDIINGKVSMTTDTKNSELGFDVVHNFIPNQFPIVPFMLPTEAPGKPVDD